MSTPFSLTLDQRLAPADEWRAHAPSGARHTLIIEATCAPLTVTDRAPVGRTRLASARGGVAGFTLIELMFTVAIVAVLAGIAWPSFEAPIQKARRADAWVSAVQIQAAQERFRGNGTRYGSLAEIGMANTSPGRHYTLHTASFDAEGYEIVAAATGLQARDTACRVMKLVAVGMNWTYASGPDATVSNPAAANRKCWNL